MKRQYTEDLIRDAVKKSISVAETCRSLGIHRPSGGSYELIRNRIKEYNIDTSHFLGQRAFAGKRNTLYKNRDINIILCSGHNQRINHSRLKNAMLDKGIEYKCSECGLENWNGKYITLDIDHINGDWSNCELNNLRFLCPNCHRQTNTFGVGKRESKKILYFCKCGNKKTKKSNLCKTCENKRRGKIAETD